MKVLLIYTRIKPLFFCLYISCLTFRFSFAQDAFISVEQRPCLFIPDSLKISYHGQSRIGFLYTKMGNDRSFKKGSIYWYYDINRNEKIDVSYRSDLMYFENTKFPNSYLNPKWLESAYYNYIATYPHIIETIEEYQRKRFAESNRELHLESNRQLLVFSLGVLTCLQNE